MSDTEIQKKIKLSAFTIKTLVEQGLSLFAKLKRYSDVGFVQAEKEIRDRRESYSEHPDSFEWDALRAMMHLEENDLAVTLPILYRGSLLLSVYGFMEHYLEAVCHLFHYAIVHHSEDIGLSTLQLKELSGKGIRRVERYLTKVANLSLPSFFGDKSRLLNELRNAFAHRTGNISEQQKNEIEKLRSTVLERGGSEWSELTHFDIEQNPDGSYHVDIKNFFIEGMVENIQKMFQELWVGVDARLSELQN